jgi:penicillin-binding protein 1A
MGTNDRRIKRRARRLEKRAARSAATSAAERASERMEARANGDDPPTPLRVADANDGSGNGSEPPEGGLTALPDAGEPAAAKPRLKKLRAALVILGLGVLALVSWIFGIMMAVAQDLPNLENRAQYERAENSVVLDRNGTRLATLTNNEGRILVASEDIAPVM